MTHPSHLTADQQRARDSFDLNTAMAQLPAAPAFSQTNLGQAGKRLRGYLRASISDALLRDFAVEKLGALRTSQKYLDALRVVLGNQADAEQRGYVLEQNIRTDFATERVMRTIIDQMKAAGITFSVQVSLGNGRTQSVQCFESAPPFRGPSIKEGPFPEDAPFPDIPVKEVPY